MKRFVILGAMLLAAGPGFAQTAVPAAAAAAANAPAPSASGTQAAQAKSAKGATAEARVEKRIAEMHQRLKIVPAQQPAWDAFAQVMRESMTSIQQAYADRRAGIATMSAPENMRNFARIEQDRADGIQKLAASFQALYDGMSDGQKAIADAMFRHYMDRDVPSRKAAK